MLEIILVAIGSLVLADVIYVKNLSRIRWCSYVATLLALGLSVVFTVALVHSR